MRGSMKEIVEHFAELLVDVSDSSLCPAQKLPANLQDGYRYFLSLCDGGYTKANFFHFFGQGGPVSHNLSEWNQRELWKKYYGLDDMSFVFAEDVFGTQFCFDVRGNRRVVKMLIPDGGKISLCANTFEEFLEVEVLGETANSQVRQLAQRFFQLKGVTFHPFTHISCKIPSSLGGNDEDLDNLELIYASIHLKLLGQITSQIRNLPTGTRIKDIRIDHEKQEITLVPEVRG